MLWNCEGIRTVIDEVEEGDWEGFDVLVLTETFATDEFCLRGYQGCHVKAVKGQGRGRPKGGVSVLWDQSCGNGIVRYVGEDCMVVGFKDWDLIALYCSPVLSGDEVVDRILECWGQSDGHQVVLAGDLNCRLDKPELPKNKSIIATLEGLNLRICNDVQLPTYVDTMGGSSVIDILATSYDESQLNVPKHVIGRNISVLRKHIPLSVDIYISRREQSGGLIERRPAFRVNFRKLNASIGSMDLSAMDLMSSEDLWGVIFRSIEASSIDRAPKKVRRAKPWFDGRCYESRREVMGWLAVVRKNPEARALYSRARSKYRLEIKRAKKDFIEKWETEWLRSVKGKPYLALRRGGSYGGGCGVDMDVMREHIQNLLAGETTTPVLEDRLVELVDEDFSLDDDFSLDAVGGRMGMLSVRKASGPDGISNRVLKGGKILWPIWTKLFNKCLDETKLPRAWKSSGMVLIPKGKGVLSDPKSWRGIALKCCAFKVLTSMMAERIECLAAQTEFIPREQHGFIKGRSTMSALREFQGLLEGAWDVGGKPVYAVFIDFRAAFDRASRSAIFNIVKNLGAGNRFTGLLWEILQADDIYLTDGRINMGMVRQTTGVAQGDCLSPLLFILLLADFPRVLKGESKSVRVIMYADDIVLCGGNRLAVQIAIRVLEDFCRNKGLVINEDKTLAVKFRRGGRLCKDDGFWVQGKKIGFHSEVKYLGVTFRSGGSFEGHIRDRVRRGKIAIAKIRKPHLLSLKTAMEVFRLCVAPVISYGFEIIWDRLGKSMLEYIDSLKGLYLKRCLGVSKYTRNRLVYWLTDERCFVEELGEKMGLKNTRAVEDHVVNFKGKIAEVEGMVEMRMSPAVESSSWREAGRPGRSLIIRASIHGLHGDFCAGGSGGGKCFEAGDECECNFCGEGCGQFHIWECSAAEGFEYRRLVRDAQRLFDYDELEMEHIH